MRVSRTDETRILNDHENRIGALERAPGKQVYIDDRVITDPVSVVTFTEFPSDREILELTWQITTDNYPEYLCMVFNGDYPTTSNDYRWRLFGNVTDDETSDPRIGDSAGVLGGSYVDEELSTYGPHWGRIRFPDYNEPTGAHAIIWQGEGGLAYGGSTPDTWLIAGAGDPSTPLTEINIFPAVGGEVIPDGSTFVAPSRLTLTCY